MLYSMTAFARAEHAQEASYLAWEIRSVNHRYLETSFRLPDTMRHLEHPLRERLRKQLARGKVECSLRWKWESSEHPLTVNDGLMQQLLQTLEHARQQLPDPAAISPLELLKWPGLLQEPEPNLKAIEQTALHHFDAALTELLENRQREGQALGQFIQQRLEQLTQQVSLVRAEMPQLLIAQRQKLLDRIADLDLPVDSERLEQELAILAQKADVDEELDRLNNHLLEVQRVLTTDEPVGRRLDFLMQELNREANTLSSKSIAQLTTNTAVEMKVLIEQMREQIQNIE